MTFDVIEGGDGRPPEPDWNLIYSDEIDIAIAREEWEIVIREMQAAKTLTVANGHAIQRLVAFRIIYERAARQVAEAGAIVKAKRTRVPQYNPHWIVMRQADETIRAHEAELGVSPSRRGRATKIERQKRKPRPADAYLNPTNRADRDSDGGR